MRGFNHKTIKALDLEVPPTITVKTRAGKIELESLPFDLRRTVDDVV